MIRKTSTSIFLLVFATSVFLRSHAQQNGIITYDWFPANTGGGGYITGIVQDSHNPAVMYARCDVGGVFKTIDGGKEWKACNRGLTKWYSHSVQSIAIDPNNSNIVFRCSGDKRNNRMFGSIHKSSDGGETWKEVCQKVAFFGNGPTRMYGELIAVDPFNSKLIIVAGYNNGIWISSNGGENWEYRFGKEERFSTLAINPFFANQYYAATLSGKLFCSDDRGRTWRQLYASNEKDFAFTELAFDKKNASIFYCSATPVGVYKSVDRGETFEKLTNGLPATVGFNTIVTDNSNSSIIYTAANVKPGHGLPKIPVYVSRDEGSSWQLLATHTTNNIKNYPGYMVDLDHVGWAISKLRVDAKNPDKIFFSNWYGVSFSEDLGKNYDGKYFNGLETNCLEYIGFDQRNENISYYTVADHPPMMSLDGGRNYQSFPRSKFKSSTALVTVPVDNRIMYGARSKETAGILIRQRDSVIIASEFPQGFVQALREDPLNNGTYYAYIDGDFRGSAGLYKSTDGGLQWNKLPNVFPPYIQSLPHNALFIEDELLNIVVGQRKNVCGTNQLLCVDPHQQNTVYVGEWTEGVFKSTDGGGTWKNISHGLPFHADTASVLSVLKADKKIPGRLYAGFIREGLWRSDDFGNSWKKVYPVEKKMCNVSSLHVGGVDGNELYIAGENLHWSDVPVQILVSQDAGATWQNIFDPALGALRIKSIDVDSKNGRIILATSGNGAFYAIRK